MCRKTLNKKLLEQIKNLKDKEKDTKKKVNDLENGELSRLRNHNQALLAQIKKLKCDKKSLNDKLEQLQGVVLESPVVLVQVENKRTNTDPVKIVTQAEDKPIEVKTHAKVTIQKLGILNDDVVANSTTTMFEGNQETTTNMIRESPTRRTIYCHLNHKSKLFNQSTYQYHSEHKQQIYVPKNIEVCRTSPTITIHHKFSEIRRFYKRSI